MLTKLAYGAQTNMIAKSTMKVLVSLLFMLAATSAGATTVYFTLTGHVTDYFGGTDFGLIVNDPVTATGSFDDSLIGGDIITGSGTLDFTSDITDLVITAGLQTFTSADDNGSGQLEIINGIVLDGFSSSAGFVYAGTNAGEHELTSDAGTDTFLGNVEILGVWDTFSMTTVPVPAAIWLFGSGLIGLVAVARKKAV
jgi:hypothetical protein